MALTYQTTGSTFAFRKLLTALSVMTLCICLFEFCGAWLWAVSDNELATPSRPMGREFRMLVWLSLLLAFFGTFIWGRFEALTEILTSLGPILPFYIFGLFAVVWSLDKGASAKSLIIWSLVFGGLAAASSQLSLRTVRRIILSYFMLLIGLSLFVYLVFPDIGIGYHYGEPVVRGLFLHKNGFGYFSAIALVGITALGGHRHWPGRVMMALAAIGAVTSGSATGLALAVIGTAYVLVLRAAIHRPQTHLPIAVLVVFFFSIAVLGLVFGREYITEFLGRSATLSGRTILWAGFLDAFGDNILLGQGSGLYSTISDRGLRIARALPEVHGGVGQPHMLYIALLGEVGLIGLILFVGAHLWLALVAPFKYRSEWAVFTAGMSMLILTRAFAEDGDGFHPSVPMMLIVIVRAQLIAGRGSVVGRSKWSWRRSRQQAQ